MKRSLPLLLILVMLLTTACQKGAPVRKVDSPTEAPPEVITIKLGYHAKNVSAPAVNQMVAAFVKGHPQYRIELVEVPAPGPEQQSQLDERLKAGAYDLLVYTGHRDGRWLEPLDPYLQRSQPEMARIAAASESLRISGRLYAIPFMLLPHAFVINRDLWEAAGLPLPASDWTWNEFREAAARLTHREEPGRIWGFTTDTHEFLVEIYLMEKAGKSYWLAAEEDLREALRLFTGMVQTDHSLPAPQQRDWGRTSITMTGPRYFEEKQAVMAYTAVPAMPFTKVWLSFNWDVLPVPVGPGQKPVMSVSPIALMMLASSAQKDAAWEFIRFATGAEGAAMVAGTGGIPADGAAVTQEAWSHLQPAPPAGTRYLLETAWVSFGIIGGNTARVAQELRRLTNLCLRGELDPDSAVDQFIAFRKQWIVAN